MLYCLASLYSADEGMQKVCTIGRYGLFSLTSLWCTHVDVVGDGGLDAVLLHLAPPLLDVLLQQVQLPRVLLSHPAQFSL